MACLRYLTALLLVIIAAVLVTPAAHAQDYSGCTAVVAELRSCQDQGKAAAAAISVAASIASKGCGGLGPNRVRPEAASVQAGNTIRVRLLHVDNGSGVCAVTRSYPSGSECAGRAQGDAGMINGTLTSSGVCDQGCKVVPNLDNRSDFSIRENGNPNAIPIRSGTWKPTGDICQADVAPKPENKDEACHTTSSGHTVCKSKDKTCVSTASGFRTCATDASNSNGKTEANEARTEAASISAPSTAPNAPTNRPGESWKPSGGGGSITNNNTGTTNNYNTYNNTGSPNTGKPVGGDGSSGGGSGNGSGGGNGGSGNEGEGDGDGNSASGGGDCDTPPVVKGDAALGMVAMQTWATRCAVESNKGSSGGTVTGSVGDCNSPFSVSGDSVEANQLRALRVSLCVGPGWAKAGEGQGSGDNPHDGAEGIDGPGKSTWKFDTDVLDKSGFGGGTCPQLGTIELGRFGAISLDNTTWWCPLISALRAVMLLLGAFISFRVLFGE